MGRKRKHGARENGEGEYPPAPVLESQAFESFYKGQQLVPESEWEDFMATLRRPLGVSFRITGSAQDPQALALRERIERDFVAKMQGMVVDGQPLPPPVPIAWLPDRLCWRFDVSRAVLRGKGARRREGEPERPLAEQQALRTVATFHEMLVTEAELGNLSRQEEVSMVPPRLLNVEPHHRVLDLCAAPGSKTQQLLEALSGPSTHADAADGFVIANDADYKRCHLLVHQAKRLKSPRLIVTNHDAQQLPAKMAPLTDGGAGMRLRFDRILCDVPCSGDGTLRKAPDLWRRWNDNLSKGVHRLQLAILIKGLQLLTPGGRLVYSTCSMNPIEDEAVVAQALLRQEVGAVRLLPTDEALPGLKRQPGTREWKVRVQNEWYDRPEQLPAEFASQASASMFPPKETDLAALNLERCMRVLPHVQDTGGFFIALFEKIADDTSEKEGVKASDDSASGDGVRAEAAPAVAAADAVAAAAGDVGDLSVQPLAEASKEAGDAGAEAAEGSGTGGEAAAAAPVSAPATGAPWADHVLAALHSPAKITGRYDAIFSLKTSFLDQLRSFFGFKPEFDMRQLVTRACTGKSIVMLSDPVLKLLEADRSCKLKLVNTGVRVFERTDAERTAVSMSFRIAQEGVPCLLPYMTKQLLFASATEVRHLLTHRVVPASGFESERLRQAIRDVSAGSCVVVLDPKGLGADAIASGAAPPLALAAFRKSSLDVELLVKKDETASILSRFDYLVSAATSVPK
uniref:SAM-dependent MTase RsmB/NOP-type domain-containing protein n=1 Tax=Chrysotila carterae TaxID=13221 RepID=A0A7S4C5M2_CHRCT|mmetsp:Transcript_4780/g.10397  ORF Transcript_4780/g.10397 Transcript_4780/m.10397 type:complete len:743 (+) Transcript_4780:140-2368(+)